MLNLYRIVLGDKKDYYAVFFIEYFSKYVYVVCIYAVDSVGGTASRLRHSQILADSSRENAPRRCATFKKDAIRFNAIVVSVTGISTKRTSLVSRGVVPDTDKGPVDVMSSTHSVEDVEFIQLYICVCL